MLQLRHKIECRLYLDAFKYLTKCTEHARTRSHSHTLSNLIKFTFLLFAFLKTRHSAWKACLMVYFRSNGSMLLTEKVRPRENALHFIWCKVIVDAQKLLSISLSTSQKNFSVLFENFWSLLKNLQRIFFVRRGFGYFFVSSKNASNYRLIEWNIICKCVTKCNIFFLFLLLVQVSDSFFVKLVTPPLQPLNWRRTVINTLWSPRQHSKLQPFHSNWVRNSTKRLWMVAKWRALSRRKATSSSINNPEHQNRPLCVSSATRIWLPPWPLETLFALVNTPPKNKFHPDSIHSQNSSNNNKGYEETKKKRKKHSSTKERTTNRNALTQIQIPSQGINNITHRKTFGLDWNELYYL